MWYVLARDEQESPQIHLYSSHDICTKTTTLKLVWALGKTLNQARKIK
jgi:hypothetical protein